MRSPAAWTWPTLARTTWCSGMRTRRSMTCARTGGRSRPAARQCRRSSASSWSTSAARSARTWTLWCSARSITSSTPSSMCAPRWPNSLWMNTQIEPYKDVRVRKAISLAIDRDKLDELLYEGAKISTIYPFPLYPNLQKFADSPGVKALEAQYNPREFNLDKSGQMMTEAGFTKNADDLWEKGGATVSA